MLKLPAVRLCGSSDLLIHRWFFFVPFMNVDLKTYGQNNRYKDCVLYVYMYNIYNYNAKIFQIDGSEVGSRSTVTRLVALQMTVCDNIFHPWKFIAILQTSAWKIARILPVFRSSNARLQNLLFDFTRIFFFYVCLFRLLISSQYLTILLSFYF